MIVAITGGQGFIGQYVQSRLAELGIIPAAYDNAFDDRHDVTDGQGTEDWLTAFMPDRVIHLAGLLGTHELWDNISNAIDVNVKGALNVGRWCTEYNVKMVSIEQPHIWYNVYEASKLAARRMLTGLHYDQGLQVDFVTAHNAYGPGQHYGEGHPRKILPTFATQAWQGGPIQVWGDGEQKVNLVYAGDVADQLVTRALDPRSYPLTHWQAGVNHLAKVSDIAALVASYVETTTGKYVDVERVGNRLGEQNQFPYPIPDDTYPYRPSALKLYATIDSYRP